MEKEIFIGVDPGVNGAIAVIINNKLVGVCDLKPAALLSMCLTMPSATFVVEEVHSSPAMGVANAFTFGESFGMVKGIIEGMGCNVMFVPPQRWKGVFGLIGLLKREAVDCAKDIFGREFQRVDEAEACLLAAFGAATTMPKGVSIN